MKSDKTKKKDERVSLSVVILGGLLKREPSLSGLYSGPFSERPIPSVMG